MHKNGKYLSPLLIHKLPKKPQEAITRPQITSYKLSSEIPFLAVNYPDHTVKNIGLIKLFGEKRKLHSIHFYFY